MRDLLALIGLLVCLSWANKFCKEYKVAEKLDKIEKFVELELK